MSDSGGVRSILPSTVSSASGTGPEMSAKKRISVACQACKRRKSKCRPGPSDGTTCEACSAANIECVFDPTQDKRRKVASDRRTEELKADRELLYGLLTAIRSDDWEHVVEQIRQGATPSELAAMLRGGTLYDTGGVDDGASADTEFNRDDSEVAGGLSGQLATSMSRVFSTDSLLTTDTPENDYMEIDPASLDNSDIFDHYQRTVKELFEHSDFEAQEYLRQLRSPMGRHNFNNFQLPVKQEMQESQSVFSSTKDSQKTPSTLLSDSTRTTPRQRIWMSPREIDANTASYMPYPALPMYTPDTDSNDAGENGMIRTPTPAMNSFASGSSTGMSQYITSSERRQIESTKAAGRGNMSPN